jgi:ubiquinone/menaquinone biosynthesis C-methylase UbiE
MKTTEADLANQAASQDSLFERCSWFYAFCREYLFHDHTPEITASLFPSQPPAGAHVLELGCGPGFYSCQLAQRYPQIVATGFDLSDRLIERARCRAASRSLKNCHFRLGDAQALPDFLYPIEAVVISRLFLIVPCREAVLAEAFRVLRPGGNCFIAEPASVFRTRIPLRCMWLLSRLSRGPAGGYREPWQADVMCQADFITLVRSQPWASVRVVIDGWYQYAVCTKPPAAPIEAAPQPMCQTADFSVA